MSDGVDYDDEFSGAGSCGRVGCPLQEPHVHRLQDEPVKEAA